MLTSIKNGVNTKLDQIEKFVDGAAVKKVGDKTFEICKRYLHDMITVPEGKICQTILELYNKDAIVEANHAVNTGMFPFIPHFVLRMHLLANCCVAYFSQQIWFVQLRISCYV